jgi:hypothetical protein
MGGTSMRFVNLSRSILVLISVSTLAFSQLYKDPNNILKNGGFDDDSTGWVYQPIHGSSGKGGVVDGQMVCGITKLADETAWAVQFLQNNIKLEKDVTYVLTFDAKADGVRPIQVNIETTHGEQQFLPSPDLDGQSATIELTTTMKTFIRTFKMSGQTTSGLRLNFNIGKSTQTVYFDNLSLFDKTKVGVIGPQSFALVGSGLSRMIEADSRGISFRVSNPAHFHYQICSPSGRLVAGSNSFGNASHYRIEFPTLGISSGTYIVQAFDGNERYSKVFSVMP